MAEHLEIEQKFDVDAGFERPARATLEERLRAETGERITASDPVLHRLSATYFDTADGRLAARKITLRRRTGGTDEGWHLKLPTGAAAAGSEGTPDGPTSRREVHAPLGTAEQVVPADLEARVAEITGGLKLAPIATLETERTVVTLLGENGRVVAEIADDAVTGRRLQAADPDTEAQGSPRMTAGSARMTAGSVRVPRWAAGLIRSRLLRSGPPPGASGGTGGRPPGREQRWREIEVEVPEAAPELQRATADLLFAAGARPAGHGSKLARVLSS